MSLPIRQIETMRPPTAIVNELLVLSPADNGPLARLELSILSAHPSRDIDVVKICDLTSTRPPRAHPHFLKQPFFLLVSTIRTEDVYVDG